MRIKALMMCRDETELLKKWAVYHGNMLGAENVVIIDNGSTSEGSIIILEELYQQGFNVDRYFHTTTDHFVHKGHYLSNIMKNFDCWARADFYFPLDCDEFLCVESGPFQVSLDRTSVEAELEKWRGFEGALMIGAAYDNHARRNDVFVRADQQRKTFFASGAAQSMDHGFHEGHGKSGQREKTNIAYLHFHHRPFKEYQRAAMLKIKPFMEAAGITDLQEYYDKGQPTLHVVPSLLMKDESEYGWHDDSRYFPLEVVDAHFRKIGSSPPYFEAKA